jgi:hypothetical protein
MIIDNFLFCNEFDILEIRLKTLYNHVDKFVIVEGDHTFTNKFKGYQLETQLDLLNPFWDKIEYIKVGKGPSSHTWTNEHWHRTQFGRAWNNLSEEDIVIISDCDEILRPEAIEFIKNTDYMYYGLYMPAFYFKFNYLDTKPDWHYKVWARAYRSFRTDPGKMRNMQANEVPGKSINIHHAGWHFGWIGNEEFAKTKIQSFAHTEVNKPEILDNIDIERHIKEGTDHFRPENQTWTAVDLDAYFPKEIIENKDKYAKYILQDNGKKVRDFWTKNILEVE